MASRKLKIQLSLLLGTLSWLLFTFFDLYLIFIQKYQLKVQLTPIIPQVFFTLMILSTLFYYRQTITKADSVNFVDLLWRVFLTGLVTTIGSLLIRFFFNVFSDSTISENPFTINFFYHLLTGLVVIYLISTFVVWKRLIQYQKSKSLIQLWRFFEYALVASLVFDFLGSRYLDMNFNTALIVLGVFAIILSFNLKWIAYLNFRQKWKSILFILLSGIYVYHFLLNLISFTQTRVLVIDLMDRVFIVALFAFIFLYAGIAVLVTLFNLPTSSVFERKMQEAVDFQKLSQSIPAGKSAEQTYDILLSSAMSAVFADAAWLEVRDENLTLARNINETTLDEIRNSVTQDQINEILNFEYKYTFTPVKLIGSLGHPLYKSIIAVPIMVKNEQIAVLVLLQEVTDAFTREMAEIITTFVSQAGISIENFRLMSEALSHERYMEQMKIANSVQKRLLPDDLDHNERFDITAYSMAADEVGGDYYDILEPQPGIFNLIIGDVSGKGTSAAFNMAQMKGVFHGLAQRLDTPAQFVRNANLALGRCLERSSFITAMYFQIDTLQSKFSYSRAGHCPALFYHSGSQEVELLQHPGLGLGIIRNSDYEQYVKECTLNYQSGDLLLLYTDGITEAKNAEGGQYGTEKLKTSLLKHIEKPLEDIKTGLIHDLELFLQDYKLDDDYTLTIVRFK